MPESHRLENRKRQSPVIHCSLSAKKDLGNGLLVRAIRIHGEIDILPSIPAE
jgi:hypothetical protein